jgi:hypothetical protein
MSVWLMTPTSPPRASTTGRPWMWWSSRRRAAALSGASAETTIGSVLIRAPTVAAGDI